jgi:hypothetical protein
VRSPEDASTLLASASAEFERLRSVREVTVAAELRRRLG